MGLFTNPLGHAGYPPGVTGKPSTLPSEVRAATSAEAAAATLNDVYISPATASYIGAGANFASPGPIGSTVPNSIIGTTVHSTGAMVAGTGLTATTGGVTATAGGVTATLGDITATNGNLVLGTAGDKLKIKVGANASCGVSAAMTAGSITISTTAVKTASLIFLSAATPGGTQGSLSVGTIVDSTSFVINSSNAADTSTVNWLIIN